MSTTKLNLNAQNIYIKLILKPENAYNKLCLKTAYLSKNVMSLLKQK